MSTPRISRIVKSINSWSWHHHNCPAIRSCRQSTIGDRSPTLQVGPQRVESIFSQTFSPHPKVFPRTTGGGHLWTSLQKDHWQVTLGHHPAIPSPAKWTTERRQEKHAATQTCLVVLMVFDWGERSWLQSWSINLLIDSIVECGSVRTHQTVPGNGGYSFMPGMQWFEVWSDLLFPHNRQWSNNHFNFSSQLCIVDVEVIVWI